MANKTLQVRLQEKIDLASTWESKGSFVPLKGEKIVYQIPRGTSPETYDTVSKTGDGSTALANLPFDSALSADVAAWAKPDAGDYRNVPNELNDLDTRVDKAIVGLSVSGKVITYTKDDGTTGTITTQDTNTDTKVTQNAVLADSTDTNKNYPVILGYSDATTAVTNTVNKASDLTYNPYTNTLTVPKIAGNLTGNITGNADSATYATNAGKLVGNDKTTGVTTGSTTKPVYFKDGVPTEISYTISKSVPSGAIFTDEKVKATSAANVQSYITGVTGAGTAGVNYDSGVYLTTTAGQLHADSLDATTATVGSGGLTVTGNESVSGTLTVTGKISSSTKAGLSISGNADTATKVNKALTFGSKTFDGSAAQTITAGDLGISSPLDFIGVTTTALTDGSTATSFRIDGETADRTAVKGDVVILKNTNKEFLYTGTAWEELGDADALTQAIIDIGAKEVKAGAGLTGGGAISGNPTLALATSGATAGNYGPSANASPAHGKSFSVPYITVDTYGRVTAASTKTITLPADSNTHYASTTVVASAAANTSDVTAVTEEPYINHIENGAVVGSYQVKNGNAINATTDASGNLILNHADTSTQTSVAANGRRYITGVTLDGYGHVTKLETGTETVTDTHHVSTTVVSSSASGTSGVTAEQTNPYVNHIENSAVRNSIRFVGGGKTTVKASADGSTITISSTDADTHHTATTYVGANNATAANATTANGATYLKLIENGTKRSAHLIKGTGGATVTSDASGNITINSTTYSPFTTTAQGITKASGDNGNILFGDNTWHGATDYIILCAGSANVNV